MNIDYAKFIEPAPAPDIADRGAPTIKKTSRANWGRGENQTKMEKAINDWDKKVGDIQYDDNGKMIDDWKVFANKVSIPPDTLYKYIRPTDRKKLGDGYHGKKQWINEEDVEFVRLG